jgi:hypothetical protein
VGSGKEGDVEDDPREGAPTSSELKHFREDRELAKRQDEDKKIDLSRRQDDDDD